MASAGISPQQQCQQFHTENVTNLCFYVLNTSACDSDGGFFEYTHLVYCAMPNLLGVCMTMLMGWLLLMFLTLGTTADDFFCPSLVVISKTLHLSDNVAGVTLLALGNGAPDVFSAIAAVSNSNNVGLALGALLGAGVFITTVVAASVIMVQPFDVMERPFLRDAIFYLLAVFLTFCVVYNQIISLWEAIAFILLYVFYVAVVLLGRFIYQRIKKKDLQSVNADNEVSNEDDDVDYAVPHKRALANDNKHTNDEAVLDNLYSELQDITEEESTPLLGDKALTQRSACAELWLGLLPIRLQDWKEAAWYSRIWMCIKAPVLFLLQLTIPLVDYDMPNENWNRSLQVLQCILAPVFCLFAAKPKVALYYINGMFPVWCLLLLGGVILAVLVFCTSSRVKPPVYHSVFSFLGFIVAVIWIASVANEIVNILQTIGVVFNLSPAILGLTLLAWGNSIPDLVADVAMAKKGHSRTGISACYGGPLFNLLLGVGIPFTINMVRSGHSIRTQLSLIEVLLMTTVVLVLIMTLITVPFCLRFHMTRQFSVVLYCIYAVFLTIAILAEMGVIHGALP